MLSTHPNINLYTNTKITNFQPLLQTHGAVLVAIGAQISKKVPLRFDPHLSARDFVLWYNGHPAGKKPEIGPSHARNVSVIGMGNVALDVARLLSKKAEALQPLREHGLSEDALEWMSKRQELPGTKFVRIFGRRGYPEASFTNKEFRELLHIEGAVSVVNPADLGMSFDEVVKRVEKDRAKKRGLEILEEMMNNYEKKKFDDHENVIQLKFNKAVETVLTDDLCDLLISSVGFGVDQIGAPMDPATGGVMNTKGRIEGWPEIYVVGWTKRGPKGNIASNIPDALETADSIVEDLKKLD